MTRRLFSLGTGQTTTASSVIPPAEPAHDASKPVIRTSSTEEQNAFEHKKTKTVIHTSLLISGPESVEPLKDHTIVIEDGVIESIESTSSLSVELRSHPSTTVPVLMPGLWDCHIHLLGIPTLDLTSAIFTPAATAGARLVPSVQALINNGVTSIRDLGSHALEIKPAIDEGTIIGPNIYSAGAALSQTAGHGDLFDTCAGFAYSRLGVNGTSTNNHDPGRVPLMLADGVEEVRRAVRLQIRRGAQVIKVLASGGVLSIADDPIRQQYSMDELKTIVDEAERQGRIVAAHCHGKPGIIAALNAGCKTIEHGTYMDEECVKLMKEKNAIYIPTRTVCKIASQHPELLDPRSYEKMKGVVKQHLKAYRLAVKEGVRIALGTDSGVSRPDDHPMNLGRSGRELVFAVQEAGMSVAKAIEAATAMGPETLGDLGMKPKSGRVEVGYDADVIALTKNPFKDIEGFMDDKHVSHVWKGGKLLKGKMG